jgi:hypothetical protein
MKEIRTYNIWRTSNEETASTEMNEDTVKETETVTIREEKASTQAIAAASLMKKHHNWRSVCVEASDGNESLGNASTDKGVPTPNAASETGTSKNLSDIYSAPISSTLDDSDAVVPMPLQNDSTALANDSEDDILDFKLSQNSVRNEGRIVFGNISLFDHGVFSTTVVSLSWDEEIRDSPESSSSPQGQETISSTVSILQDNSGQEREIRTELRGTWSTQEEWVDSLFESSKEVNQDSVEETGPAAKVYTEWDSLFESSEEESVNQVFEGSRPATIYTEWDSLFESSKEDSVDQVVVETSRATNAYTEPAVTTTYAVTNEASHAKGIELSVTPTDAVTSGVSQNAIALDEKASSGERSDDDVYTPRREYFPMQQRDQRDEQCADSTPVEQERSDFSKHIRVTVVGPGDARKESRGVPYQFALTNSMSKKAQTPIRHHRRKRSKDSSTLQDLQASISTISEGSQSDLGGASVGRFLNLLMSPCTIDQDDRERVEQTSWKDLQINNSAGMSHLVAGTDAGCDGGGASQWQRKGAQGNSSGESKGEENADRALPGCHFVQRMINDTLFGTKMQSNKVPAGDAAVVGDDEKYRSHELKRTDKGIGMPPSVIEHENSYDDDASDITDVVWNVTDDETTNTTGDDAWGTGQRNPAVKVTSRKEDCSNEILVIKKALESEDLSHVSNDNDSVVDRAIDEIFRSEVASNASDKSSIDDSFDVTTIQLLISHSLKEERDGWLVRSPTFDDHVCDGDNGDDDDDDLGIDEVAETPRPSENEFTSLLDQEVATLPDEVTGRLVSSADVKEKGFVDATSPKMMKTKPETKESMSEIDSYRLASSHLDTHGNRETEVNSKPDSEADTPSESAEFEEWVAFFDHNASTGKEQKIRPTIGASVSCPTIDGSASSSASLVRSIYKNADINVNETQEECVGSHSSKKGNRRKPRVTWLLNKIRGGSHVKRVPSPLSAHWLD